ncbi:MAG: hypothetical protein RMJ97_07010 [Raineya sp.]|nr:type IV conjugative transfer system protein TraL [Raineya sp.]MDW8296619.1 hypothetical protein [Raineya sp.]
MNCKTRPQSRECTAMFRKLYLKDQYDPERAGRRKGLSGVPKKAENLNGTGSGVLIGAGVLLIGLGVGAYFGYRYLKNKEIDGIISDQEKANNARLVEADKTKAKENLKKLNYLQLRNLRKTLKEMQEGKITAERLTDKQKKYFETAQIPLSV